MDCDILTLFCGFRVPYNRRQKRQQITKSWQKPHVHQQMTVSRQKLNPQHLTAKKSQQKCRKHRQTAKRRRRSCQHRPMRSSPQKSLRPRVSRRQRLKTQQEVMQLGRMPLAKSLSPLPRPRAPFRQMLRSVICVKVSDVTPPRHPPPPPSPPPPPPSRQCQFTSVTCLGFFIITFQLVLTHRLCMQWLSLLSLLTDCACSGCLCCPDSQTVHAVVVCLSCPDAQTVHAVVVCFPYSLTVHAVVGCCPYSQTAFSGSLLSLLTDCECSGSLLSLLTDCA